MGFSYTKDGVEHEFTETELSDAQRRTKVQVSLDGKSLLVTRPTGPTRDGMFVKAPQFRSDRHLHIIPALGGPVLLATDETAPQRTEARHIWRKQLDLKRIEETATKLDSLQIVERELVAAFSKLRVTSASGWVLTETPFSASLRLSSPPTQTAKQTRLNLLASAPKFINAIEFSRQRGGTIGLSIERVGEHLASRSLVVSVASMGGWVEVPLPVIRRIVEVASRAAEPFVELVLEAKDVAPSLHEMADDLIQLARWFPEIARRSGATPPPELRG